MPNEMTAAEAAEMLEDIAVVSDLKAVDGKRSGVVKIGRVDAEDLRIAASYLRAIAAGEYKRVVHAHIVGRGWDLHCSNCGASADIGNDYCPDCGAPMDGKDEEN
jgi:hypothetical protein